MPDQDSRPPSSFDDPPQSTPSTTELDAAPSVESRPAIQTVKSTSAKSATAVTGVSDLVRRVYDGAFKLKRPSKADVLAIRTHARIPPEIQVELLHAATKDVLLANTYQLMAILAGYDDAGFANAREFARQVLNNHPAFQAPELMATLASQPGAMRPEKAVEYLASQDFRMLLADPERERSKAAILQQDKDCKECKENAIRCLLLWLLAKREISLDRTCPLLHHHIWSTYQQRYKAPGNQMRSLLDAKKANALAASITVELLEKKVTQQSYLADLAQQAETRATARVEQLQKELEEIQRERDASLKRARLLDQELAAQKTAHADERAVLQDDYERLRGTVLRRLKDELVLMEEGLHALQRDPPRVHVMVDHADRVIDGLRLAIDRLRESRQG